jgi:hypothetical protein
MNRIRRITATSTAVLGAAASTIALAGSAYACQTVVDPFTGTPQCIDTSQPSYVAPADPSPGLAWLGIIVGVVLVVAAVLLLVRGRIPKRAPAPAQPLAKVETRTGFSTAEPADTQTLLAELEAELQDQRHENQRLRTELEALRMS